MIGRAVRLRFPAPLAFVVVILGSACSASAPDGPAVAVSHAGGPVEEVASLVDEARRAFERQAYGDAIGQADEALRRHPFELGAALVKVESHLALGENALAFSFADRLAHTRAASPEAHYALGKALVALRRSSLALSSFERALELAPDDTESKLGLLAAMAQIQRFDLGHLQGIADEITREAPRLEAAATHQLAIAHDQRGDLAAARTLYERAVAAGLEGGDPLVHYNLARLLHETVGLPAARPHYQRFLAHDRPAWRRERAEVMALLTRE